jgi:HAE1 family hydrophobic/amphiphilic exporter-1
VLQLTELADKQIKQRLESANGVGDIFIYGARLHQINVNIDPVRLRAYNISITDVSAALRRKT